MHHSVSVFYRLSERLCQILIERLHLQREVDVALLQKAPLQLSAINRGINKALDLLTILYKQEPLIRTRATYLIPDQNFQKICLDSHPLFFEYLLKRTYQFIIPYLLPLRIWLKVSAHNAYNLRVQGHLPLKFCFNEQFNLLCRL